MSVIEMGLTFRVVESGCCNTTFAMTQRQYDEVWKEGRHFHCPRCGQRRIPKDVENLKLKREIEWLQNQRQSAEDDAAFERRERQHVQHQLAATKGHQTRLKKRIAAGVCPCCHRTFQDLARHMHGQHPEFVATEEKP